MRLHIFTKITLFIGLTLLLSANEEKVADKFCTSTESALSSLQIPVPLGAQNIKRFYHAPRLHHTLRFNISEIKTDVLISFYRQYFKNDRWESVESHPVPPSLKRRQDVTQAAAEDRTTVRLRWVSPPEIRGTAVLTMRTVSKDEAKQYLLVTVSTQASQFYIPRSRWKKDVAEFPKNPADLKEIGEYGHKTWVSKNGRYCLLERLPSNSGIHVVSMGLYEKTESGWQLLKKLTDIYGPKTKIIDGKIYVTDGGGKVRLRFDMKRD